jgi:hypothetical protein
MKINENERILPRGQKKKIKQVNPKDLKENQG